MAMVEAPLDLLKVKVEGVFVNTAILVKPEFGIRPETFHAIKVISSSSYSLLFRHYYVVATDRKGGIGYPIISVI